MIKNLKRIRYVKIILNIVTMYILCAGYISLNYAYEIITEGTLPEEYYSPEFFITTTNYFAIAFIVIHFCIVILEMSIFKKYRYLKPEILFTFRLREGEKPLDSTDIDQICNDLEANEDGYLEGGDGFILINKAKEIIRRAAVNENQKII